MPPKPARPRVMRRSWLPPAAAIRATCARCATRQDLTRHHVIPRRDGGSDRPDNIQVLCRKCHTALHATEFVRPLPRVPRMPKERFKELRRMAKEDLNLWPHDHVWTLLAILFTWIDEVVAQARTREAIALDAHRGSP